LVPEISETTSVRLPPQLFEIWSFEIDSLLAVLSSSTLGFSATIVN